MLFFLLSPACAPGAFPGTVFPLSQNRQPGVRTRFTQWRHQTRLASFFVSLPQCTHFSGDGSLTVVPSA